MSRMDEGEKQVIVMYAQCSMNARKTAKKLYRTPPNVHQVLNRVKDKTGKDPRDMWQLIELIKEVNEDG